jgi:hypothetical protein
MQAGSPWNSGSGSKECLPKAIYAKGGKGSRRHVSRIPLMRARVSHVPFAALELMAADDSSRARRKMERVRMGEQEEANIEDTRRDLAECLKGRVWRLAHARVGILAPQVMRPLHKCTAQRGRNEIWPR